MGGWPGELGKLTNKWLELQAQKKRDAAQAKTRADQGRSHRQALLGGKFNPDESAYDLDKRYGGDWDRATLEAAASDRSLTAQHRAKLVEIMILRGASNDLSLRQMVGVPVNVPVLDGPALHEKALYQMAAQRAIMADGDLLIPHLSNSEDQLPSGRYPATEFMNMMLQKGGAAGDYASRQNFEGWMKGLDADTRGRLMYHLADAAEMKDLSARAQLTGIEASGPVGLGLSWENAKDTHWKEVGRDIEGKLSKQLDGDPDSKASFYRGFDMADNSLSAARPR